MVPGVPLLTHTSVRPTALSPHPSVPPLPVLSPPLAAPLPCSPYICPPLCPCPLHPHSHLHPVPTPPPSRVPPIPGHIPAFLTPSTLLPSSGFPHAPPIPSCPPFSHCWISWDCWISCSFWGFRSATVTRGQKAQRSDPTDTLPSPSPSAEVGGQMGIHTPDIGRAWRAVMGTGQGWQGWDTGGGKAARKELRNVGRGHRVSGRD